MMWEGVSQSSLLHLQHWNILMRNDVRLCACSGSYFTLRSLGILTVSYLLFMVLVGGIVIPGGLFMPSIMVRACFHA